MRIVPKVLIYQECISTCRVSLFETTMHERTLRLFKLTGLTGFTAACSRCCKSGSAAWNLVHHRLIELHNISASKLPPKDRSTVGDPRITGRPEKGARLKLRKLQHWQSRLEGPQARFGLPR